MIDQRTLEGIFADRRVVSDPNGMQIFRNPILQDNEFLAKCYQAYNLFLTLFYGIPVEGVHPLPDRTIAGLLYLAASAGKLPHRCYIEHLPDRWFGKIEQHHTTPEAPPEIVTECRLVVGEWKEIETEK